MVDINSLKYELYNLISDARKAADKIEKEAIPFCNVFGYKPVVQQFVEQCKYEKK